MSIVVTPAFSIVCERIIPLAFFMHLFSFERDNWSLFSILSLLVVSGVFGVVAPNYVYREPRTHNALKLVNDCLGRAQLSFISFYLTIFIVQELPTDALRRFIGSAAVVSATLLFIGLGLTKDQDGRIARKIHKQECSRDKTGECTIPISWRDGIKKLLLPNLILAIVTFGFAVCLSFSPIILSQKPQAVQQSNNGRDEQQNRTPKGPRADQGSFPEKSPKPAKEH